MIKKNQFALIFLTIVTMLAVWYIKAPVSADKNNSNTTEVIESEDTGRLEELALMREAIRNERSMTVMSLDAVLADEEASLSTKEAALVEKKSISGLTEKEV